MKLKVCLAQGTIWSGYSKRKTYIISLQKLKTFKQELSTWSEVWKKLLYCAILAMYKKRQKICTGTWNHASLEFKLGEDCWNIILQEVDLLLVSTDDSIYCHNYCCIYWYNYWWSYCCIYCRDYLRLLGRHSTLL